MRNLSMSFKNKSIEYEKLLEYGFVLVDDKYIYETNIVDNRFKVVVEISKDKQSSRVLDLAVNDEYMLVDVEKATGELLGRIRDEYENILKDIIDKCTIPNVFKGKQSIQVIKYIKEKYNDDLEFLWDKTPDCAIWRNKDNNKWYGLLIVIGEDKLGLGSKKLVDVINLKIQKEKQEEIVDNKKVFKGYHMNKNSWISIILDDSIDIKYIFELIDNSYLLSAKR